PIIHLFVLKKNPAVSEGEGAQDSGWIEAKSRLCIPHLTMSQPVDPKTCDLHGIEARQGNRLSAVEATTNDNTCRPGLAPGQGTGDGARVVLSIAIQAHHGIGPTPQRFGKATLQRYPLPTVPGEGEYAGPCGGSSLPTTILRGIVYD